MSSSILNNTVQHRTPIKPIANMIHLLKNIRRVECIEAYHLQHSDIIADRGVWLNVYQQFSPIDTIGLSSVEISDKIENKQRVFTTKLTMFRSEKLMPGAKKLCFRVTTVTGSQFLIGSADKPYPVIQNEETFPSSDSGKSGVTVTVTLTSLIPMLSILD